MTHADRVRAYWERVWTLGDTAYAEEFYAPTFRLNDAELSAAAWADGARRWQTHFADFSAEVRRLFAVEDGIVTRVHYRGRHVADLPDLPASGRLFDITGIDVFLFEDGRCVEHLHEADHDTMFEQLRAPADSD